MRARALAALCLATSLQAFGAHGAQAQDAPASPSQTAGDPADSGAAAAQQPPPSDAGDAAGADQRRVAVLVLASRGVEPDVADSLTEVLIAAIAARGSVRIVGKEEFQAQLGQGDTSTTECIGSPACLGRVGVELQVDEVIGGTVAQRGAGWVFNLNRIDIRSGELVGRAFREVQGDVGRLAGAVQAAVPSLYEVPRRPSTLLVAPSVEGAEVFVDGLRVGVYRDAPLRVSDIAAGSHEVRVRAREHREWVRTIRVPEGTSLQVVAELRELDSGGGVSPLVWIGAGVAVAGAGVATYFGLSSQRAPDDGISRAQAVEHFESRDTDALVANIGMAAAGAGAVTALVGVILSIASAGGDDGGDARASHGRAPMIAAGASPAQGGGLLELRGTF